MQSKNHRDKAFLNILWKFAALHQKYFFAKQECSSTNRNNVGNDKIVIVLDLDGRKIGLGCTLLRLAVGYLSFISKPRVFQAGHRTRLSRKSSLNLLRSF